MFQYMLFYMNAPKEWVCLSAPYLHLLQFSQREQKFCQILVCPPFNFRLSIVNSCPFHGPTKSYRCLQFNFKDLPTVLVAYGA